MMLRRSSTRAVLGSAVVIGTLACRVGDEGSGASEARPAVVASTGVARVEPFTRVLPAIGTVVPRPGRYAALGAPAATRVASVHVAPGARVAAGQPLVEFEQQGFVASASAAEAALTAAERNYERARRLAGEGIVPRKDVEVAAADLASARTTALAARRARQLSILRSPVTGVVTRMTAVLGQSVDAGQVLVEVADPAAFDVVLALSPTEAADVQVGDSVSISAGERRGGAAIGRGVVASVGAALDTASRSVAARVVLTSGRRALRMGEAVYAEIAVETHPAAVVVPASAVVPEGGAYRVFVVNAQGVASARPVTLGGRTDDRVEILTGLRGGERVVTQGAFGVQDSARVVRPGERGSGPAASAGALPSATATP